MTTKKIKRKARKKNHKSLRLPRSKSKKKSINKISLMKKLINKAVLRCLNKRKRMTKMNNRVKLKWKEKKTMTNK